MEIEQALSYLSKEEQSVLGTFEKIIIWGFPLHTHTHSYIHACWVKTFTALGKEVHWFSNEKHEDPANFSYKNCLIITEGFQDKFLPLDPTNTYFVHFCIYPEKYLRCGARLFEIRFNVNEFRINACLHCAISQILGSSEIFYILLYASEIQRTSL